MPESQLPDLREVRHPLPSDSTEHEAKTAEPTRQPPHEASPEEPPRYTIRRKGSRYNIFGPYGRTFTTYKSASVAGPRWEEMTGTPWPYPSIAYEPGTRLRQLGRMPRPLVEAEPRPRFTPDPAARPALPPAPLRPITIPTRLALPAPRIDVAEQTRLIRALKQNPRLLFRPEMQRALQIEIEYHRPHAVWAQKVLALEARYRARQASPDPGTDEPPLPNILDIYRNPLLALHPDQDALRAMLRDEARASGVLSDFALKLEMVLVQWQAEPDRLRWHLRQQADLVARGGVARLDHLLGGPGPYRARRVRQNRIRNAQRARRIDTEAVTTDHIAWQAQGGAGEASPANSAP